MNDFLTTLATRTLGLTPVMQPLIASIFTAGEIYSAVDGEYESNGVDWERSHGIQTKNLIFNSDNTPGFTSNQQTSNLVNPAKIEPIVTQLNSIPKIDEIPIVVNNDSSAAIPSNNTPALTDNQQTSNLVNPAKVEPILTQINSIPKIDEVQTVVNNDS
ncbi:hypothetical protein, partial [Nodularia sp. UHCC 0506]|uniref:hypothetical protein n=1 Tax=Nodularia sp. UHCC 0506 TaxID=3110243 RepID=UPI002B20512A